MTRRRALGAAAACLASPLAESTAWAASRWPEERVAGRFACHADFSLAPYAPLLEQLAELESDLVRTLGVRPSNEIVHLFVFQRKHTFQNYVRHYFPKVPDRRALFIKQRGPGMVFAYQHDDLPVDVRHECTHALLHASLPMMPLWLDEGIAEYFEAPPSQRASQHPHMSKVRWSLRLGGFPHLEELESLSELSDMGGSEYRDAWAWAHFMLHGSRPAHAELVRYLRDIAAYTPPGRLSERLARRVPNLNQQLERHFRSWRG